MGEPHIAGEKASSATSRTRHAVWTWFVFAVGGFVIAVATFVAYGEGRLLWGMVFEEVPSGSVWFTTFVGMPLIGLFALVYGIGFVSAYLSIALGNAASVAAMAVWRFGHVPVRCLAVLLITSPIIVFAQVSAFGVWFDPAAENEADALTATKIVMAFSPLLIPALFGASVIARRRDRRDGAGPRVAALAP